MSLQADGYIFAVLNADTTVSTLTAGRIFNTDRSEADETADRIPYIIVRLDGGQNVQESKDDEMESDTDRAQVSVLCVAATRSALASLTAAVRTAIRGGHGSGIDESTYGFSLVDYTLSYGPVQYDFERPCFYQALNYDMETENIPENHD